MRRTASNAWFLAVVATGAAAMLGGCDSVLTEAPDDGDLFDAPLPGLTREERAAFVRGDAQFGRAFSIDDGLGPIFNDVSCAACHSADGRGRPENLLVRFGEPPDMARALGGPQLQTRATAGAMPEALPAGEPFSRRLPPPVSGVGLIEAIPEAEILTRADPDDADGNGISGRPNWVTPPDWVPAGEPGGGPGPVVGRFSRKAQVSSLLEQVVEAYHQDMGITSDFLPEENVNPLAGASTNSADAVPDPEISEAEVRAVLDYLRMLAPPRPAEPVGELGRGETLFGVVGCASCHTPVLMTGDHAIEALAYREVRLYSDLLLHDMGEALADGRPDGAASGREWRTAPLWGLRIMRDFLNGEAFLLHDGRARSVEEAIRLHGGEALASRDAFLELSEADRRALLRFVETR